MAKPRIFVLMGQGGHLTSAGMAGLAGRLAELGSTSLSAWNDNAVLPAIVKSTGPVAVIGYSLGANQLGWISQHVKRPIDLGVAYDPSWLSPMVERWGGKYVQRAPNFKRLIAYRNVGAWVWGGSTYIGKNVEEYEVSDFHLGIQFNEQLHKITIEAVKTL